MGCMFLSAVDTNTEGLQTSKSPMQPHLGQIQHHLYSKQLSYIIIKYGYDNTVICVRYDNFMT